MNCTVCSKPIDIHVEGRESWLRRRGKMPKLEWTLKDPKSCEGCQFLDWSTGDCEQIYTRWNVTGFTRPQICIDELGE